MYWCSQIWTCSVTGDELVSFSKPESTSRWSLELQTRSRPTADFLPNKSGLVLNFTLTSLRPKELLSSAARAGIID